MFHFCPILAIFVVTIIHDMKKFISMVAAVLLLSVNGYSQVYDSTPADSVLAEKILTNLAQSRSLPTGQLMIMAGQQLLGQPYVAGTLDQGEEEKVRVYLTKTDCIIFVETCMNLAYAVKVYGDRANFTELKDLIRLSRYRDGAVNYYSDRVHYTTEWIRQGEKRGIVEDLTLKLGGQIYDHPIFFMSKNYKSYKHLKNSDTDSRQAYDLEVISNVEKELNKTPYSYIPDADIPSMEKGIRTGDIIGYMSNTPGLDIAHVVMAYVHYPDGTVIYGDQNTDEVKAGAAFHGGNPLVGFMHASMGQMKVIVDPKTIAQYAKDSKSIDGIKVVRVK
jgi:hypothetical protein